MKPKQLPLLDGPTHDLIVRRVQHLIGHAGLEAQDSADLEQELTLGLLRRLPAYDQHRSSHPAFVRVVLGQLAANLLRDRLAHKRGRRRTRSLQEPICPNGEEVANLAPLIPLASRLTGRNGSSRSDADQADLQIDLADTLAKAPPVLRDLAERLQSGQSLSSIARTLGIPRTTLQGRLQRLRRLCQRAGLQQYLDS